MEASGDAALKNDVHGPVNKKYSATSSLVERVIASASLSPAS